MEVSKKIIEQIDKTKDPAFIFAVTMQNHGPYPEDRYPEKQITVSGNLSDSGKEILETYVQGLKDADESLKLLIEHCKKSAEPTAILFSAIICRSWAKIISSTGKQVILRIEKKAGL